MKIDFLLFLLLVNDFLPSVKASRIYIFFFIKLNVYIEPLKKVIKVNNSRSEGQFYKKAVIKKELSVLIYSFNLVFEIQVSPLSVVSNSLLPKHSFLK